MAFGLGVPAPPPARIALFTRAVAGAEGSAWRVVSDGATGGLSAASFDAAASQGQGLGRFHGVLSQEWAADEAGGAGPSGSASTSSHETEHDDAVRPTRAEDGRWRTGFAALQSPMMAAETGRALRADGSHMDALRLRMRGDGRVYIANLTTDGAARHAPGAVFQQFFRTLPADAGPTEVVLPLKAFLLTFRGVVERSQPKLNAAKLMSVGILATCSGGVQEPGAFGLDVDSVELVNEALVAKSAE